ncbi:hypothetical protein GGD64_002637 [Bradyrhizobium sp. CIR3A]|nr:hypothetical protein [Bradyrhizobium sp. CIR3A]NYG47038.1 hypothetical protein [Bradyrhizobium sp. IAR9]
MLAQIVGVIEANCLEVDVFGRDPGQGGLGQDRLGDVFDRTPGDLVDERDIPVFARGDEEMTSRLVISGSTTASRPRRP